MSIGKALQRARINAGLSIGQVHQLTRIRRDVLIDFEADQLAVDPAQLENLAFIYGVPVKNILDEAAAGDVVTFKEAMTALHTGNFDPFYRWVYFGDSRHNVH